MDREIDRVVPLDELPGYEVARGEPDVRGWDVIAGDGRRIGEVDELLVDAAAKKVRFLDVAVDQELSPDAEAQRIIIPIDSARVIPREDRVFVDGLTSTGVVFSGESRRDDARDDRSDDRDDDRRDDGDTRRREPQRTDAPIVERERAIVPLDPPTR
jgi:sporulation protein YlmC with PRC-barrel domain